MHLPYNLLIAAPGYPRNASVVTGWALKSAVLPRNELLPLLLYSPSLRALPCPRHSSECTMQRQTLVICFLFDILSISSKYSFSPSHAISWYSSYHCMGLSYLPIPSILWFPALHSLINPGIISSKTFRREQSQDLVKTHSTHMDNSMWFISKPPSPEGKAQHALLSPLPKRQLISSLILDLLFFLFFFKHSLRLFLSSPLLLSSRLRHPHTHFLAPTYFFEPKKLPAFDNCILIKSQAERAPF